MRKRFFKFCLALSLCLVNWSCSLFHPESLERDSDGYLILHYQACGPVALEKALNACANKNNIKYKRAWSRKEISRKIQDSGNITRLLLALAHHEAIQITLPSEIKQVIKAHGLEVVNVRELKSLDEEVDVAIVLVSGSYLKGQMHWLCFPVDGNIIKYYGENTTIHQIFLLKTVD